MFSPELVQGHSCDPIAITDSKGSFSSRKEKTRIEERLTNIPYPPPTLSPGEPA
jgi:hypothetical protein